MKIEPGSAVEVRCTPRERDLVVEHTFAGPNLTGRLRLAEVQGGEKLLVRYTLDDLEELIGFVAAAANHAHDEALQEELDALYEQLMAEIESHDDGGWQTGC
jgi:hypothetical protein